MPRRREFLLGAAALGIGGLTPACKKGSSRNVTGVTHASIEFKVLVPKEGRDDAYPLVVAIHGLGGAPEHWVDGWGKFPGRAQIAMPRGLSKHEDGYSWFPWTTNMKDERLAADVAAVEARLWKAIVEIAAGRRVVVAGYEQGALLTYAMAARHKELLGAFPVAGACPEALYPKDKRGAAPILAFHGTADDVVPVAADRASVEAFKQQGNKAELRAYEGVRHAPSDKLHADLNDAMLEALDGRR